MPSRYGHYADTADVVFVVGAAVEVDDLNDEPVKVVAAAVGYSSDSLENYPLPGFLFGV